MNSVLDQYNTETCSYILGTAKLVLINTVHVASDLEVCHCRCAYAQSDCNSAGFYSTEIA